MGNKTKIFVPVFALILIIGFVAFAMFGDNFGLAVTGGSGEFFLRPTFGFLKCDQISCPIVRESMVGNFGQEQMNNVGVATPYDYHATTISNSKKQLQHVTFRGNVEQGFIPARWQNL